MWIGLWSRVEELRILVILKYRPKVMAPVLLEAMPQVPEEYCRTHLTKYKNSGTGVFTDLRTDVGSRRSHSRFAVLLSLLARADEAIE